VRRGKAVRDADSTHLGVRLGSLARFGVRCASVYRSGRHIRPEGSILAAAVGVRRVHPGRGPICRGEGVAFGPRAVVRRLRAVVPVGCCAILGPSLECAAAACRDERGGRCRDRTRSIREEPPRVIRGGRGTTASFRNDSGSTRPQKRHEGSLTRTWRAQPGQARRRAFVMVYLRRERGRGEAPIFCAACPRRQSRILRCRTVLRVPP